MRENIFRGRDNKNGWHYGFVDYCPIATGFFIHEVGGTAPTMEDPCGGCYSKRFEVDSDTIGQYVREKDKKGTACYEGDIMQRYKKDGTPYKGTKVVPSIEDVKTSKIVFNESLVIGNIHTPTKTQ